MVRESHYISSLRIAAQIKNISGVVVECGTWQGGMVAGTADVLGSARRYNLFDSINVSFRAVSLLWMITIPGRAALSW
jgi:hypothetical protein